MLHKKGVGWVIGIAAISNLAGILYGYCTAIIAGALIALGVEFHLGTNEKEWIATSILSGALAGGLGAGIITNRLGRKYTILLTSIACILLILVSVYSQTVTQLLLSRFGLGVCIGIYSMAVPLYVSETAPDRYRGALVAAFQLAVTIGILISYIVGLYFQKDNNWHWMFGAAVIPAAMLGVGMVFLPESPRWLIAKQKTDQARKALEYFYPCEEANKRIALFASIKHDAKEWKQVFKSPYIKVLLVSMVIFVLQNISGIDGIIYYAPHLFEQIGMQASNDAMMATIMLGAVNAIATLLSLLVIDSLGRRLLLLAGLAIMSVSLLLLTLFLFQFAESVITVWAALICLCVFIFMFAVSLGPIPFVLMSELFPSSMRDVGMSLSVTASWLANVFVTLTYLSMMDVMGGKGVFLLYGMICLIGYFFVFLFVPETRKLSLEQIESEIRAGRKLREIGKSNV